MQLIETASHKWSWPLLASFIGFIVFLPLFEAPKTVFLILYLLLGAIALYQKPRFWHWQKSDALVLLWALSGFVVALFAKIQGKEWDGAVSLMWLGLLMLITKKLPINRQDQLKLDYAVLVSTLIATLYGLWRLYITHQDKLLELNSVGHVNHSAIYLALNFALAMALLISYWQQISNWTRFGIGLCLVITCAGILIASSRTTVMVMFVIAVTYALLIFKRSKSVLLVVVLSSLMVGSAMYFGNASVVQKQINQSAASSNVLGPRQAIWNSALLVWRHAPVFGVGLKNFSRADLDMQKQWLQEDEIEYVEGQYIAFAHTHNFYLSLLAEQGMFGFSVTLSLLLLVAYRLYKNYPQPKAQAAVWARWLAAIGALEVVLINGVFNTTLHHEHGMLSVLLMIWWWVDAAQDEIRNES